MKIEEQVVSLELAKELKELGYPQNGYWWRAWTKAEKYILVDEVWKNAPIIEQGRLIAAPTVAELGEILPFYLVDIGELTIKKNYRRDKLTGWNCRYEKTINENKESLPVICGDTLANAMAKMLIYLIKENLITVEEVQE